MNAPEQISAAAAPTSALEPARLFGSLDLSARKTAVVAVSGGGDSLALLFLLKRHLDESGGRLRPVAVTIDHRLRPESATEAVHVAAIAERIGVEHRTMAWDQRKPASGVSAAAREARHELLAQAARDGGADLVLTGHTIDDQAETVAMRSLRGEGRGGAGIAPATLFDGRCWFARPLISTRRAALRDFLTGIGQGWIDDPSNDDQRYERVRLRTALSDGEVERLAAQAAAAGAEREALGRRAADLVEAHAAMREGGGLALTGAFAASDDREAAVYALRILLAAVGGMEQLPDEARTAALLEALAVEPGRATLSRCLVERRRAEIRISRERRGREAAATPQPTLGPWARYLPSFDLAPARALARLLGAAEIPPPPFTEHIHRKA